MLGGFDNGIKLGFSAVIIMPGCSSRTGNLAHLERLLHGDFPRLASPSIVVLAAINPLCWIRMQLWTGCHPPKRYSCHSLPFRRLDGLPSNPACAQRSTSWFRRRIRRVGLTVDLKFKDMVGLAFIASGDRPIKTCVRCLDRRHWHSHPLKLSRKWASNASASSGR